jgi:hypothetical protein
VSIIFAILPSFFSFVLVLSILFVIFFFIVLFQTPSIESPQSSEARPSAADESEPQWLREIQSNEEAAHVTCESLFVVVILIIDCEICVINYVQKINDQQIFIVSHGETISRSLSTFSGRGEDQTQYLSACSLTLLPT